MGQVNIEQVNLMLRLYELRREPRLREARDWYVQKFHAGSFEELAQKFPPGSKENTHFRMTVSYWDMAASIVNRGLIDDELFFESNGELWIVWERIRPFAAQWRAMFQNPTMFSNLEECCKRLEAWRERKAPGSTAAMRKIMEQMRETAKAAGN